MDESSLTMTEPTKRPRPTRPELMLPVYDADGEVSGWVLETTGEPVEMEPAEDG